MIIYSTDLDELSLHVRNIYVKKYFVEAINAYRAGSYRAAIILTWITVCIDIIEKIKELAIDNDPQAIIYKEELGKINEKQIDKMISFEKQILDYACEKLELITVIEKKHLERLYQDRNICAHPTFINEGEQFDPLPELAKSYLVQSAKYLLVHRPTVGKAVLDKILELVAGQSFPENEEKAYIVLSSESYLKNARTSLIRNLIICIIKKYFINDGAININLLNKLSCTLKALSRINDQVYSETLKQTLCKVSSKEDSSLKRIFLLVAKINTISDFIEEGINIRLHELIRTMEKSELLEFQVHKAASHIKGCLEMVREKINSFSFLDKIEFLQEADSEFLKEDVIHLFLTSSKFDIAKEIGEKLILPYSHYFNSDDLKKTINGIIENNNEWPINQILHARGMNYIFCEFYKNTKHIENKELWARLWKKILDENVEDNFRAFKILLFGVKNNFN
ncbi:hypothetical protein Lste_2045 [Legionella steelei]|uniref:Uncharacterized protein n=1 Tax=Legionella steelei TaxID=947033 RepID=A0A0W0ZIK7_9GAMM|nr:hypothetical protein [Legionella steelei]KTD68887.1 hypothetical protein Lste_2045 [Legionella steelei]